MKKLFSLVVSFVALLGACSHSPRIEESSGAVPELYRWELERTPLDRSAAGLEQSTEFHLKRVDEIRRAVIAMEGLRTVESTLVPYNELILHLDATGSENYLFARVHPNESFRKTAEEGAKRVSRAYTELGLDRELYEALKAVDLTSADAATRHWVARELRDFQLSGVDRDEPTRRRIAGLRDEIVQLGLNFSGNIISDVREITVDSVAGLDGLPADWISAHPPRDDGKVHITTRSPDVFPFMRYATNAPARKRLAFVYGNRAHPANMDILDNILKKRHELSRMLGFRHWAEYSTADKMIRSSVHVREFIEKIAVASRSIAEREYRELLAFKKRDDPLAKKIAGWEKAFYQQRLKAEKYDFDPKAVRAYFNFADVQRGLFELTGKMFGVEYRPVEGLKLWHESVTAWDTYDGDLHLGRFYLDLHPRDGKYQHAAQFRYRSGAVGRRLPQAVLVCNFPDPRANPDGIALMEHGQVVTFFHEFGHLLHHIFSGHRRWAGNSGSSIEWDFIEAPSQILEEWCFDREALKIFARHHETGEVIPGDLVEKLRRASEFGKGLATAQQIFFAAMSLNFYDRDPEGLDTTKLMIDLQKKYSFFDYFEGTHFQCAFNHLFGYSANYYTYQWSKVIAKDLFSRFDTEGVLNPKTARDYRDKILAPGGSKPAAKLVEDFLGRPYNFEAFARWLNRS